MLTFDENGNLSVDVKKDGTVSADMLIKSFLQADRYNEIRTYAVDNGMTFVPVKNFQVVYGIPKDNTNLVSEDYYTSDYYLVASGTDSVIVVPTAAKVEVAGEVIIPATSIKVNKETLTVQAGGSAVLSSVLLYHW